MPVTSGVYDDSANNGTVTDETTGLVWQQTMENSSTQMAAVSTCGSLNLGGFTDWRLPTVVELLSIFDPTLYEPAINQTYFPGTQFLQLLWTSTLQAGSPSSAWVIDFYYQDVLTTPVSNTVPFLCVR